MLFRNLKEFWKRVSLTIRSCFWKLILEVLLWLHGFGRLFNHPGPGGRSQGGAPRHTLLSPSLSSDQRRGWGKAFSGHIFLRITLFSNLHLLKKNKCINVRSLHFVILNYNLQNYSPPPPPVLISIGLLAVMLGTWNLTMMTLFRVLLPRIKWIFLLRLLQILLLSFTDTSTLI